ncbi:hypothetical protein PSTT_15492 [Puccinia striiformis]|uniref:Uncharacterized protein n=1 Tax=Puccinia striiformis TaxID=27350 RepID=A0A2S4UHE3_9BASI|nr:hypothetical protein PSTT_15492 [Puccinia striiformis]
MLGIIGLNQDGEKLADPQPINQDQGDNYWKTGM